MTSPDYSKGVACVRGQYVPIAEASIPMTDWGFLRSDATYDVVTVWDGAFFRLDAHLERFMLSCERWLPPPGICANPRSAKRACPSASNRMLAGFTSRCTISRPCKAATRSAGP